MSLSSAQTKTYSQHKSGTVFKFQIPYTDHQCVCVCIRYNQLGERGIFSSRYIQIKDASQKSNPTPERNAKMPSLVR
jgi:hypothetical protein